MGALDAVIQMLLFVCFGVYVFMGLVFLIMGAIYSSDEGAVGSTGVYLILLGLLMLVIGGIAVFANLKKIWLVLFVIELVNVALFLILFVLIVCVLMMATGTTDPVRRATEEAWPETLPTLTIPGSAGPDNDATAIYCQVYGGAKCNTWYVSSLASADSCTIGEANKLSQKAALDNCTALMTGEVYDECDNVATACVDCNTACMDAAIQDVKSQILPASYFVFFLCAYLAIVVVWNNIMIAADDLEGTTKILGLVFNGLLVLIAFIQVTMAGLAMSNADEACNGGDDCVPSSLTMLLLIGLALMAVGGVCVAGVQINNNLLLRVGTLVMVSCPCAAC